MSISAHPINIWMNVAILIEPPDMNAHAIRGKYRYNSLDSVPKSGMWDRPRWGSSEYSFQYLTHCGPIPGIDAILFFDTTIPVEWDTS